MIQIKKTILTLVALLAVTTGAWADETLLLTIESKDYTTFTSGSKTFDDKVTVTFSNSVLNSGDQNGWYTMESSLLTVAGTNGYTITSCKFYTFDGPAANGYTIEGESPSVYLFSTNVYTDANQSEYIGYIGITKIEVYGAAASSASTGPEVAWDKAEKTGTFKMPGGNVTLEPEYYPQATAAEGAVTAATGVAATTEDALVTIDETKLTGAAKMMYYVSTEATAPAYDAEGWTDVLPTAEKYTEAANLNVWYYPVGTDEGVGGATATYSDGDMNATALTVTLAAAPTFNVTFAEGTNPEAPAEPEWTASPNTDVTKGQTVTVTYSGSKKVIGVKAEKKAAAKPVTLATALEDGAIIKVYFKWRNQNKGDYVQGVYNAASGTFTASKGGSYWGKDGRAVYKVEKSGDNIIIGAGFFDYNTEGMVWTFNTTNDTYTTTNGAEVNQFPTEYGLISVSVNDTDITSTLSELK